MNNKYNYYIVVNNLEFMQNTTATATRTSENKV